MYVFRQAHNYGLYSTLYKPPIWRLKQSVGCITPFI
jgi:hypothetical protein